MVFFGYSGDKTFLSIFIDFIYKKFEKKGFTDNYFQYIDYRQMCHFQTNGQSRNLIGGHRIFLR